MKSISLKMTIIVFAAMMTLPAAVKATILGTVDIQHIGFGANEIASITTIYGSGYIYAGAVVFNKTGGTGEGNYWSNGLITGFCIEPEQPYPSWPTQYNVMPTQEGPLPGSEMGLTRAKYIEELWGRYYDPSWETGANSHEAAAFAVAIWEILKEDLPMSPTGWDVGTGSFSVAGDYSLANEWLYSLNGSGPKANLRVFSNCNFQDYIAAVPEPATIVLLGIGAVVGVLRRRRTISSVR